MFGVNTQLTSAVLPETIKGLSKHRLGGKTIVLTFFGVLDAAKLVFFEEIGSAANLCSLAPRLG